MKRRYWFPAGLFGLALIVFVSQFASWVVTGIAIHDGFTAAADVLLVTAGALWISTELGVSE